MNALTTSAKKLTVKMAAAIMAALIAVTALLPITAKASWKSDAWELDLGTTVTGTGPANYDGYVSYHFYAPFEMKVSVTFSMEGNAKNNKFYVFLRDDDTNCYHCAFDDNFKYTKSNDTSSESFTCQVKAGDYYIGVQNYGFECVAADYSMTVNAYVNKATKLTSAKKYSNGVELHWTSVKGASYYYVYRKIGSGNYEYIGYMNSNSTSCLDKGATSSSKTYSYIVVPAFTYDGEVYRGLDSNSKSVK